MILSPSLLSSDFSKLGQELQDLQNAGLKWVHWDVMDGNFVPTITLGSAVIEQCRKHSSLFFDVHLMTEQPQRHIDEFVKAGADMLVIHAEAGIHIQKTLAAIKSNGIQAGLALNPATPLCVTDYILDVTDMILLMSVNPGFGGQSFLAPTYEKIRQLKQKIADRNILIQVDGGVSCENAARLCRCGADVLVSGSAFFRVKPYSKSLALFQEATNIHTKEKI